MQEEWNRSHTGDRPAFKQDPKPLLREIIFVSVYSHCQVVEPGSGKYSVVFFAHLLSHTQMFNLERLLTFCASIVDKWILLSKNPILGSHLWNSGYITGFQEGALPRNYLFQIQAICVIKSLTHSSIDRCGVKIWLLLSSPCTVPNTALAGLCIFWPKATASTGVFLLSMLCAHNQIGQPLRTTSQTRELLVWKLSLISLLQEDLTLGNPSVTPCSHMFEAPPVWGRLSGIVLHFLQAPFINDVSPLPVSLWY